MSEHVTKLSEKKDKATISAAITQEVLCFDNGRDNVFQRFFPTGVLMPSFSGYRVPMQHLCCLLKRTSLTSIHELLINLLVVHQVNITVLNSLW